MVKKRFTIITLIPIFTLFLSGCGAGQILDPTAAPTITATSTFTQIPANTATPEPTATTEVSSTPTPEGIAGIDSPVISEGIDIKIKVEAFKTYVLSETGVTFTAPPGFTGYAVVIETSADDEAFAKWLNSDDLFVTFSNGEWKDHLSESLAGSKRTLLLCGRNITIDSLNLPGGIVIDLSSIPQTVP